MENEIPLFPLNTVLFPGAPLHLHIFEERYKHMIEMCIQENHPFGVALIRQGKEALGLLAEPYDIACSARIAHVKRLSQGRMNIVALGKERLRILSVDRDSQPYLVGRIRFEPIHPYSPEQVRASGASLLKQAEQFIAKVTRAGGVKIEIRELPDDPLALAYMAAAMLQIPPQQKQSLFEINDLEFLIARLREIYQRELALLEITLSGGVALLPGGFSRS